MPNLLLTTYCNRSCPYCFAQERMGRGGLRELSLENLIKVADFVERTGPMRLNLLGGEPSLHPKFPDIIEYLAARNFALTIFTNGMICTEKLDKLARVIEEWSLPPSQFKLMVNVNEERYRQPGEFESQQATMSRFPEFSCLSFNLFESDCDLSFLVELSSRLGLLPQIRLGLASPISGMDNSFLSPGDCRSLAEKLVEFAEEADRAGIDLVLDCGFPLCIFSEEQLGRLYKSKAQMKFICRPTIDIDPDLDVFHCFPLSGYRTRKLEEFQDIHHVARYFRELLEEQPRKGIFPECQDCRLRSRDLCQGGCKGHYVELGGAA